MLLGHLAYRIFNEAEEFQCSIDKGDMKLLINGKEEPFSFAGKTLGDFLVYIEQGGVERGNVVRSIKFNGEQYSPDSPLAQQTPLSEIETLEMEVSTLLDIIDRNVENADAYLMKLIPGIEKAVELFRSGNEQEANQFFLSIIDGMDWLSQVLDMILTAKEISPDTLIHGKSFKDRRANLIDFTEQMVNANKNKDWVLMADLLEYEILPYYRQWSSFLPQFRSQ